MSSPPAVGSGSVVRPAASISTPPSGGTSDAGGPAQRTVKAPFMPAWAWPGTVQRYGKRPFLWNVMVSRAVLPRSMSGVFFPPMAKSCAIVPTLGKLKVTVSGLGIDVWERRKENSYPLTEMVVAAARAGDFLRAEPCPVGVSAAMLTEAMIRSFMVDLRVGLGKGVGDELEL